MKYEETMNKYLLRFDVDLLSSQVLLFIWVFPEHISAVTLTREIQTAVFILHFEP